MARIDVLVVSIGATSGWRAADAQLAASLQRAGATVELVQAKPARRARTFALTDFVEARAARAAAERGLAAYEPRAVIYCSITAALLWPRPGAVWLDSIAAENRPGRHGIWQRTVERRRLEEAPLVLVFSPRSLEPLNGIQPETVVVPAAVEGSSASDPREIAAITYAGDPVKRRLDVVLHAWSRARRGDERLVVTGIDELRLPAGAELAGRLPPPEFHALLRRSKLFVAAPVREDFGIAALEALAAGCMLITTPSPGPYPARDLARKLDPRLVTDDLPSAIRMALDDPAPAYPERAAELLAPYRRDAVDRVVAEAVLPRLLS
jgi:glycosyltransferase involved in cell wall biosynthesis